MKLSSVAMIVLGVAAIVLLASLSESEKDTPEIAQRKADCKKLEAHIFRISPEARSQVGGAEVSEAELSKRIDELVAKVPEEDIEQCAHGDPAVLACMQAATVVSAVRACIPPPK